MPVCRLSFYAKYLVAQPSPADKIFFKSGLHFLFSRAMMDGKRGHAGMNADMGAYAKKEGYISMGLFNENFANLLTGYRDDALEKLRSDKRYIERKRAQNDLRAKLEAIIGDEAKELLEEYAVSGVILNGIEFNGMMLCGMSLAAELQKHFDASTPEYKAFADEFLS
jgi:hypothetical protein